ncbi:MULTISPECIES: arabinan endo-1,5-alpha-L-arabinosidase [unclassified Actinomyces]|uniref:arabinan endo-1,5-alpha-L-arabinosidase n=1 Tax=unclassified Actinomyces TaxID=2609248 RepID=UPI0020181BD6|nr:MULTISPECIES: arabinan endo-1,5-alpha-L-arabinosidase [unclassified Actinomyces]MCL3777102.1 arabinan endo-1,5-alpha-L-arabinosidase [Actinomyces sp. AC-20-1]MCL3790643.1 arabinan endo-1,5-alpha-L-arabinosidase [Actinomyces sp. 187325]MCL3792950.1 arabinan endo-1,5-alpha-L-arabinosidase [Actinomyces sp. 186855]MCL3794766.1 arabinan endo-1,5-alpha-L-arabinosidase [Actinomyces sp. 217892]
MTTTDAHGATAPEGTQAPTPSAGTQPAYLRPGAARVLADPGLAGAHDPTVIRSREGTYYLFSTDTAVAGSPGTGVQVRASEDLLSWRWVGHAFDGVPETARLWSGAEGVWAPDVVERDGEYRMYYSASSFGSRRSCINLATATSLEGPWTDRGPVVRTREEDPVNAIDAAVVRTPEGRDLMLYGSFFGGLRLVELDERGLTASPDDLGTEVCRRTTAENGPVEGSHMWFDDESGRYVLLCSFDSLFDTYNIRAARAERPEGPFTDPRGRLLGSAEGSTSDGGLKVLGSLVTPSGGTDLAPGHSNHLLTEEGMVLVHHVRDGADPSRHRAQLRRLAMTASGWPVASPVEYDGADLLAVDGSDLTGTWQVWRLDDTSAAPVAPRAEPVAEVRALPVPPGHREHRALLSVGGEQVDAVVWRTALTTSFAGLGEHGVVMGVRER